jgi:ABC-2 type transport system permease protein
MAMRIIDLAVKDLSQIVRDWKAAAFLVIMPVAFTLLFGFVFSGTGEEQDPRLPLGILDQDGGSLSGHLLALLESSDAVRSVPLQDEDLAGVQDQVRDGDLAAVLIIPAGYSEQVLLLAVDTTRPTLIVDEASSAGHAAQTAAQAAMARLLASVQAARLSAQALEVQGGTADRQFLEAALARAVESWRDPPLTITTDRSAATAGEQVASAVEPNDFAHSSAGIMVQFAMAGLIGAAGILVLERKSGALRRLLTTSISRLEIILGHYLAMFVMILAQLLILVVFGQFVLGVAYLHAPGATLLMIVVTALWSASLGLLIGIFAKTEEQVIIFALLAMLLLAGLGGAWMPLEFTSQTFQTVGHLAPTAWAIDGFENIVVRGLGIESVLLPAAVSLAYALALFGLALWRFRFE